MTIMRMPVQLAILALAVLTHTGASSDKVDIQEVVATRSSDSHLGIVVRARLFWQPRTPRCARNLDATTVSKAGIPEWQFPQLRNKNWWRNATAGSKAGIPKWLLPQRRHKNWWRPRLPESFGLREPESGTSTSAVPFKIEVLESESDLLPSAVPIDPVMVETESTVIQVNSTNEAAERDISENQHQNGSLKEKADHEHTTEEQEQIIESTKHEHADLEAEIHSAQDEKAEKENATERLAQDAVDRQHAELEKVPAQGTKVVVKSTGRIGDVIGVAEDAYKVSFDDGGNSSVDWFPKDGLRVLVDQLSMSPTYENVMAAAEWQFTIAEEKMALEDKHDEKSDSNTVAQ